MREMHGGSRGLCRLDVQLRSPCLHFFENLQNHVVSAFGEVLIVRLGGRFSMTEVKADSEAAGQTSTA